MRIAVLGGTFDPVHNAHIQMARAAADAFALDKVLFIPTGHPPHKLCPMAAGHSRLDMLRAAARADARFEVSDIEVSREGTTYTVDTLEALSAMYPGAELFYIVGADTLGALTGWRSFDVVKRMCEFLVFERGGAYDGQYVRAETRRLAAIGVRIHIMRANVEDISSSSVRRAAAAGEGINGLVPLDVADMIMSGGYYRHAVLRDEIAQYVRQNLSPKRAEHTWGVEHMAASLAMRHGHDHVVASMAALLHDCAKELPDGEIINLSVEDGHEPDGMERDNAFLLHGFAGAALAKRLFGINDEYMLDAVRWHVTGRVGMSALDMILCVADIAEPGRPFDNADIRTAAYADLKKGCRMAQAETIAYIAHRGLRIYPRTVYAYNDLIER